jgi:hypothetical protein
MKIKPREWLELTKEERLVVLQYAAWMTRKRWERRLTG